MATEACPTRAASGFGDLIVSGLFSLCWEEEWVRLVKHGKWVCGQADPEGAPACPTLSYSTGGGWGLESKLGKWGEGKGLYC